MEKGHKRSASWRAFLIVCLSFSFFRVSLALEVPVISPAGGNVQAPALLSISHANPSGAIFYTTDGTDPRDARGRVRRTARVYRPSRDRKSFGGAAFNQPANDRSGQGQIRQRLE